MSLSHLLSNELDINSIYYYISEFNFLLYIPGDQKSENVENCVNISKKKRTFSRNLKKQNQAFFIHFLKKKKT